MWKVIGESKNMKLAKLITWNLNTYVEVLEEDEKYAKVRYICNQEGDISSVGIDKVSKDRLYNLNEDDRLNIKEQIDIYLDKIGVLRNLLNG